MENFYESDLCFGYSQCKYIGFNMQSRFTNVRIVTTVLNENENVTWPSLGEHRNTCTQCLQGGLHVQRANKTRLWATLQWLFYIHYLWAMRMEDGNWHTDIRCFSSLLTPILHRFSLANIRCEFQFFHLEDIEKQGTIPCRHCQDCTEEEHSSP